MRRTTSCLDRGLSTALVRRFDATVHDIGPRAAGNWVGVQNCIGNISGVVCPLVTGFVVERTGEFFWAFAIACGVTLLGLVAWCIIISRVEPLSWGEKRL